MGPTMSSSYYCEIEFYPQIFHMLFLDTLRLTNLALYFGFFL